MKDAIQNPRVFGPSDRASGAQAYYQSEEVARSYLRRGQGLKGHYYDSIELQIIDALALADKAVLDVGTGTGRVAFRLKDRARLVVAGDYSWPMLKGGIGRSGNSSNVALVQFEGSALPFHSQSFDLVTCYGLFEYVSDLQPFLREFRRLLRTGGYLVFTCHNSGAWWRAGNPPYSIAFHSPLQVESAATEAGYEIVEHRTVFYINPRLLWGTARALRPVSLDGGFVRAVIALERTLSARARWRLSGRAHLLLARRP